MAAAALTGTLVVTLAVLGVDLLRFGWVVGPAANRTATAAAAPGSAAPALVVAGTFAGFVVAGISAWWLLAPLHSLYRRAALALASSFATVALMLAAVPVHQLAGQPGLLCLALLLGAGAFAFTLRARHAARDA